MKTAHLRIAPHAPLIRPSAFDGRELGVGAPVPHKAERQPVTYLVAPFSADRMRRR